MSDLRIIPNPQTQPTAIDMSLHQMKDGRWEATIYGYKQPLYVYANTLNALMLNISIVIEAQDRK